LFKLSFFFTLIWTVVFGQSSLALTILQKHKMYLYLVDAQMRIFAKIESAASQLKSSI
jgi:hypothetical protein